MIIKSKTFIVALLAIGTLPLAACQRAKLKPSAPKVSGPKIAHSSPPPVAPEQKPAAPKVTEKVATKETENKNRLSTKVDLPKKDDGLKIAPPMDYKKEAAPVLPERKPQPSVETKPALRPMVPAKTASTAASKGHTEEEILFIIGTNSSMLSIKSQLMRAIDLMMVAIPAKVNLRVGVIAAHGPYSPYHATLIRANSNPAHTVLKTQSMKWSEFRWQLAKKIDALPADHSYNGGNWGLASVHEALSDRRRSNQKVDGVKGAGIVELLNAGLFQPNVNKTIIFIADGNDACSDGSLGSYHNQVCQNASPVKVMKQVIRRQYNGGIELHAVLVDTKYVGSSGDGLGFGDLMYLGRGNSHYVEAGELAATLMDIGAGIQGSPSTQTTSQQSSSVPASSAEASDLNGIY